MLFRNETFRDPFRELDSWARSTAWGDQGERWMALDSYRHGDVVTLELDLPGIDPATIDLTVQRNELKVEAERRPSFPDGAQFLVRERPNGRFVRRLFVSDNLDTDHVDAQYDHGVLTIRLPLRETAKPRRVEVKAGEAQAAIEANAG
jgi:HSP20 family protein